MEEDEAEQVDKQKCTKKLGKLRFLEGPGRTDEAKLGPKWLQDGSKLGQDGLKKRS